MPGWVKLHRCILDSSVWQESQSTRLVWVTILLSCSPSTGELQTSVPGLAARAGVSVRECDEALAVLLAEDRYSRTPDAGGRRLEAIEGGFRVINHAKYTAPTMGPKRAPVAPPRAGTKRAIAGELEAALGAVCARHGSVAPTLSLALTTQAVQRVEAFARAAGVSTDQAAQALAESWAQHGRGNAWRLTDVPLRVGAGRAPHVADDTRQTTVDDMLARFDAIKGGG